MLKQNPFRPGSGTEPPFFAGRELEIKAFKNILALAISSGNIMHSAIYGEAGIGKTALIKHLNAIAKDENCLTINAAFHIMDKPPEFIAFLLQHLKFAVPEGLLVNFINRVKSLKLPLGIEINVDTTKQIFEPQIALTQALSAAWEDLQSSKVAPPLVIFFLDDIHLGSTEDTLYILRNSFVELSNKGCRYMLVVTGTPPLFSMFGDMASPLTRFFNPTELRGLNEMESEKAITFPIKNSGVQFADDVVKRIKEITEGYPFYIQLLCYYLYENAVKGKVDMKVYNSTIQLTLNDMAQRRFSGLYNSASPSSRPIIDLLAKMDKPLSYSEISGKVTKIGVKKSSLGKLLERLKDKGIVRQIEEGTEEGKYILFDKFFKEYIRFRNTQI
jgi:energy-coupling factor transporter ATP-binding protein EcfA2